MQAQIHEYTSEIKHILSVRGTLGSVFDNSKKQASRACWCISIISKYRRQRQEDQHKFKASMVQKMSARLFRATWGHSQTFNQPKFINK